MVINYRLLQKWLCPSCSSYNEFDWPQNGPEDSRARIWQQKKNLLRTRFEEHLKLEAYFLMPVHIQEPWKYILSLNRKGDRIISYFWDLPSCNSECKTEMILNPGCNLRKFFSSVKFTCSCIIGKILLVCLAMRELPCISENLFPLTILWRFCHSYADIIIEDSPCRRLEQL